MDSNEYFKIRSIRDGNWYWIDRKILNNFGKEIKPTGIAIYNVLASFSNSKTQSCFPSQQTIADLIQVSRKTVIKNMRILKKLGLISIEKKGGSFHYLLLKPDVKNETQGCEEKTVPEVKSGYTINKYKKNNNNNIVSGEFINSTSDQSKAFTPKNREQLLAWDISIALNDFKNFSLYLSYAKKYPETLLRKVLGEVKEVPPEKIKSSRSAFFNHLIRKHEE